MEEKRPNALEMAKEAQEENEEEGQEESRRALGKALPLFFLFSKRVSGGAYL
jgi:hypothetical protein